MCVFFFKKKEKKKKGKVSLETFSALATTLDPEILSAVEFVRGERQPSTLILRLADLAHFYRWIGGSNRVDKYSQGLEQH